MAGAAGAGVLGALRTARRDCADVRLHAADGSVCVARPIACVISPVLKAALTGDFVESARQEYALRSHTVSILDFMLDFMCGDERRLITGENRYAAAGVG
tara:strand:- start:1134 stop:1433 length:300 start_codon:yes stop_codon:yes gene_type:complete